MENNNSIQSLTIKDLFTFDDEYKIPIYQRNYAWEKGQIEQLIQDVLDFSESGKTYYIGTLVVFKRKENNKTIFETIDGQQRLTTLSILLSVLKNEFKQDFDFKKLLTYESRKTSTKTLESIYNNHGFTSDCNPSMKNAYKIIQAYINKIQEAKKLEKFTKYLLENVEILRVNVPDDTDLNHYFEVMNNRGEQLEKHEILKADMLSELNKDEQIAFSKIWDACSDMSRYVQYGFSTEARKNIFGEKWNDFKITSFEELLEILGDETDKNENECFTLGSIIDKENEEVEENEKDEAKSERFVSPVNFQNFLLHILRIQLAGEGNVPLDDKRLLDSFKPRLEENFVKTFGFNLLKAKFLFDNYIIKRDYSKDSEDGEWSLKALLYGNSSAQYNNSFENNENNEKTLKLLSMFHVSNPSQTYKHWLTGVLNFLFSCDKIDDLNYISHLETMAKYFFKRLISTNEIDYEDFIFSNEELDIGEVDYEKLDNGTNVENFIFNYLDYLLWKKDTKKYPEFNFTFRSSVEHFYPQNPLDGNKLEEKYLNSFGNLCLISSSKNSKLSNLLPGGKKDHYPEFDGVSPKQFLMMQEANGWEEEKIEKHRKAMLEILKIL